MGCGGSTPEEPPVFATQQDEAYQNPTQAQQIDDIKFSIARAENMAVEAGPEKGTFLSSVLAARHGHEEDAAVMADCCNQLQQHNRKLKSLIATADAEAVHESFNGGWLGMSTNEKKLIAVLCSRTKSQLDMMKKRYRALYDKDAREEVKSETAGYYGKMISFAMLSKRDYVAEMFDKATSGWGCDETILVELFVMCEQSWLQEGKAAWEGKSDKSLIDYLNKELGTSYASLGKLLLLLLKGDLNNEDDEPDDAVISEQVETVRTETSKSGWSFSDDSTDVLISIIGANNAAQNVRLAELYENKYNESLAKGITDRCATKIGWCLESLLIPRSDFVARRIQKAIAGWGTDKMTLVRLLGGLDGRKLIGVLEAYETKYAKPLASSLNVEIGGHFANAALTWIRTLDDPSSGVEDVTEQSVSSFEGDAAALTRMCDFLLLENEMLMRFAASLDVETLAEAVRHNKTDDTRLIRTLTTRAKRFLGRLSYQYREENDTTLSNLVDENCEGWYAYLAKFLVLQPSQSDALLLDLALDDPENVDTNALIEFLCARHPRRVRATKKTWEKRTDESLVDRLSDSLHGDLRTVALTMLKGKRSVEEADEETADQKLAKQQAKTLKDDMSKAIEILCSNSTAQNAAIARQYEDKYDCSLGRAIGEEFNGTVKSALTALTLEPAQWYASRLRAAFKGMSTSDRTVCRIVGAHDKDEIRLIAAAYDDKYGRKLATDISTNCTGNYKRLAVAWISLPDQLAQPDSQIELPEPPPVEASVREDEPGPDEEDDDDEEDEENPDDLPDPSSSLYKAKIMSWSRKLEKAEAAGKERRTAYYRRLLTMYPPLPSGHKLLKEYIDALEAEYTNGDSGMVKLWIEATNESDFTDAGTKKDTFDQWQDTSEAMVRDGHISLGELKAAWGIKKKTAALPATAPAEHETPYQPPNTAAATTTTMGGLPMGQPPPAGFMKHPSNHNLVRNFHQPQPMMMPGMPQLNHMQMHHQAMHSAMTTVQHTVQQTIIQQPQTMGLRKMAATVPFGMYGGMQMQVNTPHGRMAVTIPPGYGPGSSFTFNVPVTGPLFA